MQIPPINPQTEPTFGYSNKLKTLYKKGLLPQLKVDPYGKKLTKKTATIDHIIPHSICKTTKTDNVFVADYWENNKRGAKLLSECTTKDKVINYFKQLIGIKVKGFDGDNYIKGALKNVNKQGFNIQEFEIWG